MGLESLRGYFQLASGLGEVTRARATEAALGLMSMPGVGNATSKVAGQVGALAEELLAAAVTNREHLTTLVRSEVDVAVTRLGLVPADKLAASQAEVTRLRAEVARLRSAATRSTATPAAGMRTASQKPAAQKPAAQKTATTKSTTKSTTKTASTKSTATKQGVKRAAAKKSVAKKAASTSAAAVPAPISRTVSTVDKAPSPGRSAVTTRRKPAGT